MNYICLVYCLKNNKHTIAKVRENANRHGDKNAAITKWRHWWQLLSENEKKTFKIQNIKAKCKSVKSVVKTKCLLTISTGTSCKCKTGLVFATRPRETTTKHKTNVYRLSYINIILDERIYAYIKPIIY